MSARRAFTRQRYCARRRGVDWNLSFEAWQEIWAASGKWEKRGCGLGRYCMCRRGDVGAYEVGNVYIDTFSHNSQTGPANFAARRRALAVAA